jgi:hypothetical protein
LAVAIEAGLIHGVIVLAATYGTFLLASELTWGAFVAGALAGIAAGKVADLLVPILIDNVIDPKRPAASVQGA